MRILRVALVAAVALGLLWIGQGTGLVPGSFMTGRMEWAAIGSVLVALALVGLGVSARRRPG